MRRDRIVAVVVVVLVHACFGVVLLDPRSPGQGRMAEDSDRPRLRFIARPTVVPRTVASRPNLPSLPARPRPAPRMPATPPEVAPHDAPPLPSQGEGPLVLSLPAAPLRAGERDLFARQDKRAFEAPSRLNVTLHDSSFVGRYQQFLKDVTCEELRRAMRNSPSSANTIQASMSRRGCSI
ncbi:hypothetical protein [Pseudoxanthomonas sp. Root630]|uniref:hypothetical protein n=1 Tax=Pseudoxanthomonas sp. Root630 TaxID=1736574 RepID=UPI000ADC1A72|nr:hypothetical protein [Pseudoxanthomonas sp. Root630]